MNKKYKVWRKYITGKNCDFIVSWETNHEYVVGNFERFIDGNCIIIDVKDLK